MSRARAVAIVACVAAVLAACGGTEVPRPSPPSTSSAPASPSPSPIPPVSPSSPPPSVEPTIRLPDDAPTAYAGDVPADALPQQELVPPDAVVTASAGRVPGGDVLDGIALAWARGDDPFAAERGVVVWQRFDDRPAWRVVYGFTDPASRGVFGIRLEAGDVTRDAVDDLLTFEETGGSGGCGTWRVVVSVAGGATEVWRLRTCDTQVRIARGGIEVREAVFEPDDAHCCPSAYRLSRLAWNGEALEEVRSTVSPAPAAG